MRQIADGPDYLDSTIAMISAAYPDEIDDADYVPLLAVLHEHMSFRIVALLMSLFEGHDYGLALNDAYGAPAEASEEAKDAIKDKLRPFGYEAWVLEDDDPPLDEETIRKHSIHPID